VALPEVDVSLTIPAHNEAENIGRVLHDVMAVLGEGGRTYEIVLVDDASADDTVAAARSAMGEAARNLTVVTHKQQRGYAITVCDGLRASRGKVLAFMDGDGQWPQGFHARALGCRHAHPGSLGGVQSGDVLQSPPPGISGDPGACAAPAPARRRPIRRAVDTRGSSHA
jgi:glycosyltransferase involved in cell wall biosynthesis